MQLICIARSLAIKDMRTYRTMAMYEWTARHNDKRSNIRNGRGTERLEQLGAAGMGGGEGAAGGWRSRNGANARALIVMEKSGVVQWISDAATLSFV